MAFVIDASVALVWFLPDEESTVADAVLLRCDAELALVPDLFWHEMRNVLMMACRRQRLSFAEVHRSMMRLSQLKIDTVSTFNSSLILDLAERHRLTAYLALAIERQVPLATLDRRLMTAAVNERVVLIA
ncbi:PIN domain-containing protein [Neorhizobium lilium]|uniref:PIN domain-containing protein n=1 Tax=Neorhizobium lilium TaxID=2503024 RepID=A0A3S3REV2_9HYPH|nr:type II toxin-antitoxin system VapC family toxin [Neorhizobium lilium]RWX75841.1 PIN domain-containing protein [Neorhizobium lilium]